MPDVKISALPASTTPLAGTEVLPIVQSATTRQVSVANLTAGRAVNALSLTASSLTSGRVTYAGTAGLLQDSANLKFDGNNLGVGGTLNTWASFKAVQLPGGSLASFLTDSVDLFQNSYYDGSYRYSANGYATRFYSTAGTYNWETSGASNTGGAGVAFGGFTPLMKLDASGSLGLGVTPSTTTLPTIQSAYGLFTGSNETTIANNAVFNSGFKYVNSFGATKYYQSTSEHSWHVAPSGTAGNAITFTQAMTLNSSGNLLVGTTSGVTNGGFSFEPNYNGGGVSAAFFGHSSSGGTGNQYCVFAYNGTSIGSITQSGTSAVLYNVTSDQRLKTNVVDAPSGNIDDIKIRSFNWIADGTHQEYGMVAQELFEVAPYAVNKPENPDEMMGVDYSKLVPMMIKEIQDLKQRITALENK